MTYRFRGLVHYHQGMAAFRQAWCRRSWVLHLQLKEARNRLSILGGARRLVSNPSPPHSDTFLPTTPQLPIVPFPGPSICKPSHTLITYFKSIISSGFLKNICIHKIILIISTYRFSFTLKKSLVNFQNKSPNFIPCNFLLGSSLSSWLFPGSFVDRSKWHVVLCACLFYNIKQENLPTTMKVCSLLQTSYCIALYVFQLWAYVL